MLGSWPLGMPSSGSFYTEVARSVEQHGFELLCVGDHLFMYSPNADCMSVLAGWASVTERVSLVSAVLLMPLREPAVAAKQLATIDYLSGGRLVAGVGVGGEIEQEWAAMEVPVRDRGARTDEYLEILKRLWSGEEINFEGKFRSLHGVTGSPLPATPGGPPIWVGGRSDAALRRAARHDGWCAYACSPRRIGESVGKIHDFAGGEASGFRTSYVLFTCIDDDPEEARATATKVLQGRYHQDFSKFLDAFCAVGDADHVRERVEAYRAAGVDDVLLLPQVPAERYLDQVDRIADLLEIKPSA